MIYCVNVFLQDILPKIGPKSALSIKEINSQVEGIDQIGVRKNLYRIAAEGDTTQYVTRRSRLG